jgi:hypothetical protein
VSIVATTLYGALVVALVVITAALLSLVVIVVAQAAVRRTRAARRARRVAAVRPAVIALASADDPDDTVEGVRRLRRAERHTLADVAYEFLGKVRGVGRVALVELLIERGVGVEATRRLRRPGAVGRARAAATLGQLGDPAAVPALAARLDDRDPEVRFVAARALGQIRDARAVAPLLASLTSRRALPLSTVAMWVLAIGPPAIAPLREALRADEPLPRAVAAELLGRLGALEATDDLVGVLRSADEGTRERAARSLGLIGSPRAVAPMVAEIAEGGGSEALRRAVVEGLGAIEDPSTVDVLTSLLADDDHEVARAAAKALVRLGPAGRARLENVAASESEPAGGVPTGGAAAHAAEALARDDLAIARRRERHR